MHDRQVEAVEAARNQGLFREVNERIEEVSDGSLSAEVLCECAGKDCTETISVSESEHEAVRAVPTHVFVKPGRTSRTSSASSRRTSAS